MTLLEIANDRLRLVFAPTVGGRLISLTVDGRELLWRNPALLDAGLKVVSPISTWPADDGTLATWTNLGGSKSWPAPQGWSSPSEWAGPPDAVLDAGEYTWSESASSDGLRLVLSSADDPRTGLRIERRFDIPNSGLGFTQTLVLTNTSNSPIRWAPWEVCQVDLSEGAADADTAITVTVDGTHPPINLGDYHGTLTVRCADGRTEIPIQDVIAKRGFADANGSVAWHGAYGEGLELRFEPVDGADYPDSGSLVEVWMQTPMPEPLPSLGDFRVDARLAELEVLGPLVDLAPGDRTELVLDWIAHPPTR